MRSPLPVSSLGACVPAFLGTLAITIVLLSLGAPEASFPWVALALVASWVGLGASTWLTYRRVVRPAAASSRFFAHLVQPGRGVGSRLDAGPSGAPINAFLDRLEALLETLHDRTAKNHHLADRLNQEARDSAASVADLTARVHALRAGLGSLDQDIAGASASIEEILANVASLARQIEAQDVQVSRSGAAIEEMLAAVSHVASVTGAKVATVHRLVGLAHDGGRKVRETNQVIAKVAQNAEAIMAMTDLINDIADRTNLLAMNAGIEAAHAGAAGRGFAVVAEEIRKLAASTGSHAQKIAGSLKDTGVRVAQAQENGLATERAFSLLEAEVREFSVTMDEVAQSMSDLGEGGGEVLSATTAFVQSSQVIAGSSQEMALGAREILTAVHHVGQVSSQALTDIATVEDLAQALNRTSLRVSAFSNQNRYNNSVLTAELTRFHPFEPGDQGAVLGIDWNDFLSVGIASMDAQHQELFRRINALLVALLVPGEKANLRPLVAAIREFAVVHFRDEEEVMECHGCPLQEEHRGIHSTFLKEFQAFEARLLAEGLTAGLLIQLQDRVVNWLLDHIGKVDRGYGEFIRQGSAQGRARGRTLARLAAS